MEEHLGVNRKQRRALVAQTRRQKKRPPGMGFGKHANSGLRWRYLGKNPYVSMVWAMKDSARVQRLVMSDALKKFI